MAGQANQAMFTEFKAHGVHVRYCTGTGDHNWPYWRGDLANWLIQNYGAGSNTCPNGWTAPPQN